MGKIEITQNVPVKKEKAKKNKIRKNLIFFSVREFPVIMRLSREVDEQIFLFQEAVIFPADACIWAQNEQGP